MANESLIVTGTPCSGPHNSPCAKAASASLARTRAPSSFSVTMALSAGLCQGNLREVRVQHLNYRGATLGNRGCQLVRRRKDQIFHRPLPPPHLPQQDGVGRFLCDYHETPPCVGWSKRVIDVASEFRVLTTEIALWQKLAVSTVTDFDYHLHCKKSSQIRSSDYSFFVRQREPIIDDNGADGQKRPASLCWWKGLPKCQSGFSDSTIGQSCPIGGLSGRRALLPVMLQINLGELPRFDDDHDSHLAGVFRFRENDILASRQLDKGRVFIMNADGIGHVLHNCSSVLRADGVTGVRKVTHIPVFLIVRCRVHFKKPYWSQVVSRQRPGTTRPSTTDSFEAAQEANRSSGPAINQVAKRLLTLLLVQDVCFSTTWRAGRITEYVRFQQGLASRQPVRPAGARDRPGYGRLHFPMIHRLRDAPW